MVWHSNNKTLFIPFDGLTTTIPTNEINQHKTEVVVIIVDSGYKIVPGSFASNCSSLTTLTLPDTIECINDHLLHYTKVVEFRIPKNTNQISSGNPFDILDPYLERFTIHPENQYFKITDDILYTKNMKKLIAFPGAKRTKSFFIPASVEVLGSACIGSCKYLENIVIPPSVTSIQSYFCNYMTVLKNVTILYSSIDIEVAQKRVLISDVFCFYSTNLIRNDIEWIYIPKMRFQYTVLCRKTIETKSMVTLLQKKESKKKNKIVKLNTFLRAFLLRFCKFFDFRKRAFFFIKSIFLCQYS